MGEIGITKAEATGRVFNLKKINYFNWLYAAAGAEGTIALGAGEPALKNNKGVVIYAGTLTKGVNSLLAAGESCNCLWPSFSTGYYYPCQAPVIVIILGPVVPRLISNALKRSSPLRKSGKTSRRTGKQVMARPDAGP